MTDLDFLKEEGSGDQEQFEIVTMTDELQHKEPKIASVNLEKKQTAKNANLRAGAFALKQNIYPHQESHPFLTTILLLTILGSVISMGFSWWYMIYQPTQFINELINKTAPQEINVSALQGLKSAEPPEQKEKPEISINKFFMEQISIINLTDSGNLYAAIEDHSRQQKDNNVFIRLQVNHNGKSLPVSDLLQGLGINLKQEILSSINQDSYNLFAYVDSGNSLAYGAIAQLINTNSETRDYNALKNLLKETENSIIQKIESIIGVIPKSNENPTINSPQFNDGNYKGVNIRYYNFKNLNLALDYAVIEQKNLLIFTTSKDSMFAVIDRILKLNQGIESYPQENY